MELRAPKAVLFDLGGTLLREESSRIRTGRIEAFLERSGYRGACSESVAIAAGELEASIRRVHRENHTEFRVADWIAQHFETTEATHRQRIEVELFAEITELSPMPDIGLALSALAADRIPMGVVSNAVFGSGALSAELARHDLLKSLRFVVSSADLGVRKPSVGIFEHALAILGTAGEDVWFIGDSWENDVLGASGAGMVTVWFNPDRAEPGDLPERCSHQTESWLEFVALYGGRHG